MSRELANGEAEETVDGAKPPFLKRVRIRGYKSIEFCDVELSPLTVFVGRNASGKSNFLDALAFLVDLMEVRATKAVNDRGGWEAIRCRTSKLKLIEFEVHSAFTSRQSTWSAEYSFALEFDKKQVCVRQEKLNLVDREQKRKCGFQVTRGEIEWEGLEFFEDDSLWTTRDDLVRSAGEGKFPDPRSSARQYYGRQADKLMLSVLEPQPFLDLSERLRTSNVHNFHPSAIRLHQPSSGSPILAKDGNNLARAIEGLEDIEPETIIRLGAYLTAMVPEIDAFKAVKRGDFKTVRFWLRTEQGQKAPQFDASSMSDGTLRILAALVAAFQIVLPNNHPGFVAIEEPETALHPAAMRALVDALSEATTRTQILLSTHSAELLDNPTIRPENVRVVEMRDGKTLITPVDAAAADIVRRKLNTLGGLERDNLLEPNLDDLKRQKRLQKAAQELRK